MSTSTRSRSERAGPRSRACGTSSSRVSIAVVGAEPSPRLGRPRDPAQHRGRRLRRRRPRGESQRPADRGHRVPGRRRSTCPKPSMSRSSPCRPPRSSTAAEQCGRRGVRSLVVITAGLGDSGPELLAICRRYGMRLVGPNCFGVAVPAVAAERDVRRRAAAGRHGRPGHAVRRHRHRAARSTFGRLGIRRLVLRVGRRQVRHLQQRPADLVGAGRADPAGRAVRRVVRQPARLRPDGPASRAQDAGPDDHRRAGRRRASGRPRRTYRRGGDPAAHAGSALRPGRHHRHSQPGRAGGGRRAAVRPSRCRPAAGSPSCPTPAAPGCWPRTRAATSASPWRCSATRPSGGWRALLPAGRGGVGTG